VYSFNLVIAIVFIGITSANRRTVLNRHEHVACYTDIHHWIRWWVRKFIWYLGHGPLLEVICYRTQKGNDLHCSERSNTPPMVSGSLYSFYKELTVSKSVVSDIWTPLTWDRRVL